MMSSYGNSAQTQVQVPLLEEERTQRDTGKMT